jgi:rubrerythrin
MFEQAVLRDLIQELLDQTSTAEKGYASLASRVTDPDLRSQVQHLHRDKQRHLELAERLMEIVG